MDNLDIYPTERHCVDCDCRNYVKPDSEFEAGYRKGAADCRCSLDRMDALEQQRDELLSALKLVVSAGAPCQREHPYMWDAWQAAIAVIRRVE